MRKIFFIDDTLTNKISYWLLAGFLIALPFDFFYSELILIGFTLHTLIHCKKNSWKNIFSRRVLLIISIYLLGLNGSSYLHSSYQSLLYGDVVQGLTKPLFSGFIIATVGCYFGMKTTGGTQGVGRSTTQAVVVSSVFIIIVDLLVTRAMIGIFGS